jgi:hypothetical protein
MRARAIFASSIVVLAGAGCHHASDPTPLCFSEPPAGTHQSTLRLVTGSATCGTGGTSVTSLPVPEGHFVATIRFVVNRARPSTIYYIQRAAETGFSATDADGTCQRGEGAPPGSGSTTAFVSFPIPWRTGPLISLTTDGQGNGSIEFEHQASGLPRGARFDVQMRLVDDLVAPTSELRSGCMTIEVR